MTHIIQLSDLHFGSNDIHITDELQKTVIALNPDVVVVSGDLTTRARTAEFLAAKEFLNALPGKQIIIPGNHDISLYNIFRRFYKPLRRFKKIIDLNTDPKFVNSEVIVIGLNSSRSFTIKGGNISGRQIQKVQEILRAVPRDIIKIVATHHPLEKMRSRIIKQLRELGVKVFISGHMHRSGSAVEDEIVFVRAGTATSVRYRSEPNSFNSLTVKNSELEVHTYTWDISTNKFIKADEKIYRLKQKNPTWDSLLVGLIDISGKHLWL